MSTQKHLHNEKHNHDFRCDGSNDHYSHKPIRTMNTYKRGLLEGLAALTIQGLIAVIVLTVIAPLV